MDCSPPGSSVHEIYQARILEWVAMSSSRGSSQPSTEPRSPTLQADSLLSNPPGKSAVAVSCLLRLQSDHSNVLDIKIGSVTGVAIVSDY